MKSGVLRCPAYMGMHSFACSDGEIKPSATLLDCAQVYAKMTLEEQSKLLNKVGWWQRCTSWNHTMAKCQWSAECKTEQRKLLYNGEQKESPIQEHSQGRSQGTA